MNRSIKKSLPLITLLVIFLGFLFPFQNVSAADSWRSQIVGGVTNAIPWVGPFLAPIAKTGYTVAAGGSMGQAIIGQTFESLGPILNAAISNYSEIPKEIYNIWKIIRNVVNLGFILLLIVMAFGTIFNIPHYTFKELFVPFLIAAILINFSYVIGTYIFDIGNGLSKVFLTTIQDAYQSPSLADLFRDGLSWQKLDGIATALKQLLDCFSKPIACATGSLLNALLGLFFSLLALFAMVVVVIFVIIRQPVIWILLILSPLAWFGLAFPSLKKFVSGWWGHFLGWVFWLPSYIFILMILAIILHAKPEVGENWAQLLKNVETYGKQGAVLNFFDMFNPSDLTFYGITMVAMIGGIWASFKIGKLFHGGAGTAANWVQNKLYQGAKYGVMHAPIPTGAGTTNVAAEVQGLKKAWEGIRTEGLGSLYGGERAQKLREAGAADRYRGAAGLTPELSAQKELSSQIEKEAEKLEKLNLNLQQFNARLLEAGEGTLERQALRQLQAKNGWFARGDTAALEAALADVGGSRTVAGKALLKTLDSTDYRDIFADPAAKLAFAQAATTDSGLRKSLYKNMGKAGQLSDMEDVNMLLRLTRDDAFESREKSREYAEKNIKKIYRDFVERNANLVAPLPAPPAGYNAAQQAEYTAAAEEARRLLANIMLEEEQILDYNAYNQAINYFGGPGAAKSTELREKINKYSPILGAEIEFRNTTPIPAGTTFRDFGRRGTPTTPVGGGYAGMRNIFKTRLDTIGKKYAQVADASEEEWETESFEDALKMRVAELEVNVRRTKPRHFEINHDVPVPDGTPDAFLVAQKDGAGREYLRNIQKETQNVAKLRIIRKIIDEYKALDSAAYLGASWAGIPLWTE